MAQNCSWVVPYAALAWLVAALALQLIQYLSQMASFRLAVMDYRDVSKATSRMLLGNNIIVRDNCDNNVESYESLTK